MTFVFDNSKKKKDDKWDITLKELFKKKVKNEKTRFWNIT